MEYKTIIDDNGNIIDRCVMFIEQQPQYFEMREKYKVVELYNKNYVRPRWNGTEWVECATDEEIKASKEDNKENTKPTAEERILVLESAIEDLATMICEISEGVNSNG